MSSGCFFSSSGFLTKNKLVGDTLYIENDSYTGKNPLLVWVFGLELSSEHVGLSTSLGLVHRTLVHTLLLLAILDDLSLEVNNRHDRELLLGLRLFQTARRIPSGSINLHTEHVGGSIAG